MMIFSPDGGVEIVFAIPPTALADLRLPSSVVGGTNTDRTRLSVTGTVNLVSAEGTAQRGAAGRVFTLAATHVQSNLRYLGVSADEAVLFDRLASRVLGTDGSLRASAETIAANELGQPGLWPHAISGDLPILLAGISSGDHLALVRQVLQAQEYWRLKGLKADVVMLNEHPVTYLDEIQAQLTSVLEDGPWSGWQHRPGGAYLLRADRLGRAERGQAGQVLGRGDRPLGR